jgi:hypothetical protein
MRQQINLYQPVLSGQRTPLSARTATLLLGTVCAALSLWWLYGATQVANLEEELQSAQAQEQRQAALVRVLGTAQANRAKPVDLQARARQLGTQLTERRRILALLQSGELGTTEGFADRLAALARQRVEGVWLDHIVLSGAPGVSSLAGRALDPNLVPPYLQALAADQHLRGTRFDEFHIGPPLDTDPAGAATSHSAGDRGSGTDAEVPQKAPAAAIGFRASSVAPPPTQTRSSS